jgi:mannose-6-phosphate isomerase-like protein (cupin superfamily)
MIWQPGADYMRELSRDVIILSSEAAGEQAYDNHAVAQVNDHVIRISTMTEPYHWHCHPDSDESFLVLEGGLYIDLDHRTVELQPGAMFTVEKGLRHRTRPIGTRSVNLTFERVNAKSEALAAPAK